MFDAFLAASIKSVFCKRTGLTSVGVDVTFHNMEFVYGIPEHAESLALKSTMYAMHVFLQLKLKKLYLYYLSFTVSFKLYFEFVNIVLLLLIVPVVLALLEYFFY